MGDSLELIFRTANYIIAVTACSKNAIAVGIIVLIVFLYNPFQRTRTLPVFTFNASPTGGGDNSLYCAVCLHDVAGGEKCRRLPKCNHCFHMDCIDAWLQSRSTCPLCRRQVSHVYLQQHQPRQQHQPQDLQPSLSYLLISFLQTAFGNLGKF